MLRVQTSEKSESSSVEDELLKLFPEESDEQVANVSFAP